MSQHTFSIKRKEMLRTSLRIGLDVEYQINEALTLLDTGAGLCHMSYALWKLLDFDEVLQKEIDLQYANKFYSKIKDMSYDDLPLRATSTLLGDNRPVKVYMFKLDYIRFGAIRFDDVHVRLINSGNEPVFIIGWHILKYLKFAYRLDPNCEKISCVLNLLPYQRQIYEKDRQAMNHIYTSSRFNYMPDLNYMP